MKRLILFFFLLSFHGFLFADLIDVYKKGEIKIVPEPEFGKNTNWDLLLYKGIRSISFTPDGSFFVSGRGLNKIFKFDSNGNLIKSFGKKGQGPGDFVSPRCLSILDDKYLLVGFSDTPDISIYSIDGIKLSSFKIEFERRKVTEDMKKRFIKMLAEEGPNEISNKKNFMKNLKPVIFPKYTPYYSEIKVDSDHNILVYKWKGEKKLKMQHFKFIQKMDNLSVKQK